MKPLTATVVVLALGCQAKPAPSPTRTDLTAIAGDADRVAVGDLDGDGDAEVVLVDAARMRVLDAGGRELASRPVTRGIQRLVATDIDGDGRPELLAGWGMTRAHRDAGIAFTVHRLAAGVLSEEIIFAPESARQDVTAILPMPDAGAVLLAYFASKYDVVTVVATPTRDGWRTSPSSAPLRMATSYARGDVDGDGRVDLVVGRVYGDAQGADGDAFVLAADGTRTPIPSTRGLRSLAVVDIDGDGRPEVVMGDGWHQNYGKLARGLLSVSRHVDGRFVTELVEDTAGQYAIEKILPATIDGRFALVTMGTSHVRVFRRAGQAWQGLTIAGAARDVAVGDLDGAPGDEIVVLGDTSAILRLRARDWPAP